MFVGRGQERVAGERNLVDWWLLGESRSVWLGAGAHALNARCRSGEWMSGLRAS